MKLRYRAKGGSWRSAELAVLLSCSPQHVNGRIRARKIEALDSAGRSPLIPHTVAAAVAGMSVEDTEAAWPQCAEQAQQRAAAMAAKDKRNQRGHEVSAPGQR
jgi:hypothetical protein